MAHLISEGSKLRCRFLSAGNVGFWETHEFQTGWFKVRQAKQKLNWSYGTYLSLDWCSIMIHIDHRRIRSSRQVLSIHVDLLTGLDRRTKSIQTTRLQRLKPQQSKTRFLVTLTQRLRNVYQYRLSNKFLKRAVWINEEANHTLRWICSTLRAHWCMSWTLADMFDYWAVAVPATSCLDNLFDTFIFCSEILTIRSDWRGHCAPKGITAPKRESHGKDALCSNFSKREMLRSCSRLLGLDNRDVSVTEL